MSITSVREGLQAFHLAISGVASAPTDKPGSLKHADLPLVWTQPGPASWDEQARGLPKQKRVYVVSVFVCPTGLGRGIDEGYDQAEPILQAFGAAYLGDRTFGGIVEQSPEILDEGLGVLSYGSDEQQYHGFQFRITTIEKPI